MARDSEKAMAMLNRFLAAKKSLNSPAAPNPRRPHLTSTVTSLPDAQRHLQSTIRDISRLVSAIQNGSMGEARVREMNDEINRLLREKGHWERRVKQLGGEVGEGGGRVRDADGRLAMGGRGGGGEYYYFGAAKELPGVRELFERRGKEEKKRGRGELSQLVDVEYYGLRDDEDGLLRRVEKKAEKRARKAMDDEWRAQHKGVVDMTEGEDEVSGLHVELPSTEQIEQAVLAKRKAELLSKYSSVT